MQAGLVGVNSSGSSVTSSYFNSTTTEQTTGVGRGALTGVTSSSTTELQMLTASSTTWNVFDWDFGNTSQYPALRSYEKDGINPQTQGEILCGQPSPRAECTPIIPTLLGDAINFGAVATATTLQLVITGENLNGGSYFDRHHTFFFCRRADTRNHAN